LVKKKGEKRLNNNEIKLLKSNTLHMMHTHPMGLERQGHRFSREYEVTGAV